MPARAFIQYGGCHSGGFPGRASGTAAPAHIDRNRPGLPAAGLIPAVLPCLILRGTVNLIAVLFTCGQKGEAPEMTAPLFARLLAKPAGRIAVIPTQIPTILAVISLPFFLIFVLLNYEKYGRYFADIFPKGCPGTHPRCLKSSETRWGATYVWP
jgi:hypothetical protein